MRENDEYELIEKTLSVQNTSFGHHTAIHEYLICKNITSNVK